MLTVLQIHLGSADGDILVFLPGQEEIESLEALLRLKLQQLEAFVQQHQKQQQQQQQQQQGGGSEFRVRLGNEVYVHRSLPKLLLCPIYAALPFELQQQALLPAAPPYKRKVQDLLLH